MMVVCVRGEEKGAGQLHVTWLMRLSRGARVMQSSISFQDSCAMKNRVTKQPTRDLVTNIQG
jgi:hypothetical protein